jgi:two-component system chemotaxis response regulator CheB
MNAISVLIVDDSALMRNLVSGMLRSDPEIRVAGTAMNGRFALRKAAALNPDVIVLDLEMPELDGIGFLEKRKENNWTVPVVILSSIARKGAGITMKALSLGASDFVTKPSGDSPESNRETAEQLIAMVKAFGSAYRKKKEETGNTRTALPAAEPPGPAFQDAVRPAAVLPPPQGGRDGRMPAAGRSELSAPVPRPDDWPIIRPKRPPARPEIIAVAISTGGPNALRQVFANLSAELLVPIVVVQHMPAGFTAEFANSLNNICPLEVKEAGDGDLLKPGRILIAPGDRHVKVEKLRLAPVVRVVDGGPVNGHKPSAGVLFDSVAEQFGNASIAIIMTGMGRDGAREIGRIYEEGGVTLAQDEGSSVVFGMPRAAAEHGYITRVVSLEHMAGAINDLAGKRS